VPDHVSADRADEQRRAAIGQRARPARHRVTVLTGARHRRDGDGRG
jgi:hypothetical protein